MFAQADDTTWSSEHIAAVLSWYSKHFERCSVQGLSEYSAADTTSPRVTTLTVCRQRHHHVGASLYEPACCTCRWSPCAATLRRLVRHGLITASHRDDDVRRAQDVRAGGVRLRDRASENVQLRRLHARRCRRRRPKRPLQTSLRL